MTAAQQARGPAPVYPSHSNAIWALVLALFGGCCFYIPTIVGVVMGFKVLRRCDDDRVDHGRSLGIAAVIVGGAYLGVAVFSLGLIFGTDATDLYEGQYAGPPANADATVVEISQLKPRDCFDDPRIRGARSGQTRLVDCDKPHDAEVIGVIRVNSSSFPGLDGFDRQAHGCREPFASYVGIPLARSELATTYFYPSQSGWSDPATHKITCLALHPKDKLTESVWQAER